MELGLMGKGGKSRNLALKDIEEEIEDSEDEDEDWMLENVWKHKSYLDPQIKVMDRLILL